MTNEGLTFDEALAAVKQRVGFVVMADNHPHQIGSIQRGFRSDFPLQIIEGSTHAEFDRQARMLEEILGRGRKPETFFLYYYRVEAVD